MYLYIVLFYIGCTTAFCAWKNNDTLGYYFESESGWIYSLEYKNWYFPYHLDDNNYWLYHKGSNSHFRGWIYLSNDIKSFSYFVPSYIITDSKSLLSLGSWLFYNGENYLFWNNQLKEWSSNPFVVVYNQYYVSSSGGWANNDLGRFTWDDQYALNGLSILNKQMPSTEIVQLGDSIIKRFFDALNSKREINDEIIGEFKEGWTAKSYTGDMHNTWNAHTSLILDSVGQFYLSQSTIPLSKIDQLEEIFAYMKKDWINLNSGGYFNEVYLKEENIDVPFNMVAASGLACLTLHSLTSSQEYFEYASEMFRHIVNNIHVINDCAIWPYNTNRNINEKSLNLGDDISHGAIVIKFIKIA